jgi:hypothetical protein
MMAIMVKLTPTIVAAVAASLMPALLAIAPPAGAAVMPLSSQWRACDGTKLNWVPAVGDARAIAHVTNNGSGSIVTTVDMATTLPNTHYDVRVIQVPRPSNDCAPGASGVIVGGLQTDATGAGSTTFSGPIAPGASGAWVLVERPATDSQTPAEFYTSEFAAPL